MSIPQVKLTGEGADDAGGVFDDVVTEICRELMNESGGDAGLNLFIPTPNAASETGFNRDKCLLNSERNSPRDLRDFWFIGKEKKSFKAPLFVSAIKKVTNGRVNEIFITFYSGL